MSKDDNTRIVFLSGCSSYPVGLVSGLLYKSNVEMTIIKTNLSNCSRPPKDHIFFAQFLSYSGHS